MEPEHESSSATEHLWSKLMHTRFHSKPKLETTPSAPALPFLLPPQLPQMIPSGLEPETLWLLAIRSDDCAMKPVVALVNCWGRASCYPFFSLISRLLTTVSLPQWSTTFVRISLASFSCPPKRQQKLFPWLHTLLPPLDKPKLETTPSAPALPFLLPPQQPQMVPSGLEPETLWLLAIRSDD